MKKLFLLDFNTYLYKSYYAFPQRVDKKGRPTSSIYGLTHFLLKLISKEKIDYIGIVSEDPRPSVVHKKAFEFKATHPMVPLDLKDQIATIEEIIDSLGIPIYKFPGFQSDDIFGAITNNLKDKDVDITIVSSNKNLFQLINKKVRISNPNQNGFVYDLEVIRQKFLIEPYLMPMLLALIGDRSINVPGVKGIGIKKAGILLTKYGSIEKILQHLREMEPKASIKQLIDDINTIIIGRRISLINKDIPIKFNLEDCRVRKFDIERLSKVFHEFDLIELLDEISTHDSESVDYATIWTEPALDALIEDLSKRQEIVVDTETTGLDPLKVKLVGIAVSIRPYQGWYIPVGHNYLGVARQLDVELVLDKLKPILENENIRKIGQNIKYDYLIFLNYGIDIKGIHFDTMIASFLADPTVGRHSLDDMALGYLSYKTIHTQDIIGKKPHQLTMDQIEIDKVSEYACEDADITFRLKNYLEPILTKKNLTKLFYKLEIPLVTILAKMQFFGVKVDIAYLHSIQLLMEQELKRLEEEIYALAAHKFNINSHQQLVSLFTKKLNLIKNTQKTIHIDSDALERLAKKHMIAKKILMYKSYYSIKKVHIDGLLDLVNPQTNCIHTSFNQVKSEMGRLSSSEPNLQNIPMDIEGLPSIRKGFVAKDGCQILLADYLQIELRILAHLSKDANLINGFKLNRDMHSITAAKIFGISQEDVTNQMRQLAKKINFTMIRGIGVDSLAKELKISKEDASSFIRNYFKEYPGVRRYIYNITTFAKCNGYVTTILKRMRYLPQINSTRMVIREQARRTVINTPIQGSASDIMKLAMVKIAQEFKKYNLISRLIIQIHDELVFEVPLEELEITRNIIKDSMENIIKLYVPLSVNIGVGKDWEEAGINARR